MKKMGFSLLACALLAACASQQPAPVTQSVKPMQQQNSSVQTSPSSQETAAKGVYNKLTDPNSILSQRTVYFDFDKYNVKDQFAKLLIAHANYLTSTKGTQVSLQGHTDERGTAEYNLALGQKRAEAVKTVLVSVYGVAPKQVETISYGKERPAAQGSNEDTWAKNRRAEIVYVGEAKFPK